MTCERIIEPVIVEIFLPSPQATHYRVPLHPYWEPWPLMTEPTVLPPEQIPEASVQMALAPGMSDDNWGDEFRAFVDDQIRANGSTPGQVSDCCGEKKPSLLTSM
jgi:hypothetical protein